ncbi:bifunctional tetrahydrofolate synthase/dihydrofolate synthase [Burkholderiaceae bacterium DAT-1]|nr:bifunctional tetrahydrofolate synthase/dihydrofolate synthase [Burkholderiaceae bacterium DAT-1]
MTLAQWLTHLEAIHPITIDMGLERVRRVRDVMVLSPAFPVVIVGGTNGKGSTCAMLTAIFRAAGYKVGTYTSPHLIRYNERVCINGLPAGDEDIVESFSAIEEARGETSLTYFEFGTLAAMHQFVSANVDVAILEVGLGGRLDAVNIFEPDVSAVVSVDLDHQSYLGDTREAIGFEKAGIFRSGKPAIYGEPHPPATLVAHAQSIGADLWCIGRDFGFVNETTQWRWTSKNGNKPGLPFPALRGAFQLGNASVVIAILEQLRDRVPVSMGDIKRGLVEVELAGRFQVLPGRPSVVLDVGHNPHAAKSLANNLLNQGFFESTRAIFGAMADKDIAGVIELLKDQIDIWHLVSLPMPRAASAQAIASVLAASGAKGRVILHDNMSTAWEAACKDAGENDRIVVFGSFVTVAEAMVARGQG